MSATDLPAPDKKAAVPAGALRIGAAAYHPSARQLYIGGKTQFLEPRLGDLLMRLAEAGGPVSRETLLDDVWGDEGSDEALTQAVSKLRRALGDTARPYRIIETAPKYGYRLRRRHETVEAPVAPLQETPRHKTEESLVAHVFSVLGDQLGRHRSFLGGVAVGAGGVVVLVAVWLVLNGPGEIEQEIVCPEQATGAECLDIVNAVLGRGK